MTTKERIVDEALTLFSCRGFSGVGVREIATAVGIRDSSLYKHFPSKQAIFDTIVTEMSRRMDLLTNQLHIGQAEQAARFSSITEDELIGLTRRAFLFYWRDPFAARFRRMLTIEQYRSSGVASLYRKLFLEDSISYQTGVFRALTAGGVLRPDCDPEEAAVAYYSPLFFLIQRYDGQEDREAEALDVLDRHVHAFCRLYTV